ncbi:MarR family winged helix-turn-helix transcriptional regulator [Carboxylicivirga caseinilyticus]|uniref:MarR family winged helix-turn-helix transcriptional regulator n=1 Tax=Carboxylicivirga caseinilyticus TaxID=3417572 RepID=UPI003D342F95|nr:winged helix DNA-binding protein [Marinilabiliaceae bacterium A049]
MGRYDIIKQLISSWEQFESESLEEHNLLNFSEWMIEQIKEKSISNTKLEKKFDHKLKSETEYFLSLMDVKTQFQEYVLRIARFEEFYIRKYLVDLPLNSRLEYLFLYTIKNLEKAKKTDLINIHLVEYTTGMDTIRRLVRNKFIIELQDDEDRRAKNLALTEDGKILLKKADKRMEEARNAFLACISPNKWKKTMPVLREINDFHNNIYINHYDKPYAELSNLMDSLKHIHK